MWKKLLSIRESNELLFDHCYTHWKQSSDAFSRGQYEEAASISSQILMLYPNGGVADITNSPLIFPYTISQITKRPWMPFGDHFIYMVAISEYFNGRKDQYLRLLLELTGNGPPSQRSWYPYTTPPDDFVKTSYKRVCHPSVGYNGGQLQDLFFTLRIISEAKKQKVDLSEYHLGEPDEYDVSRSFNNGYLVPGQERSEFTIDWSSERLLLASGSRDDGYFNFKTLKNDYSRVLNNTKKPNDQSISMMIFKSQQFVINRMKEVGRWPISTST
jgi:hypothetical protein